MILSCCKAVLTAPCAYGNSCAHASERAELSSESCYSMPLRGASLRMRSAIEEVVECTSWARRQPYWRELAFSP